MSKFLLLPYRNTKMKVGLLGGSFNPAHEGHLHISLEAIKRLNLDMVIWLVSPQNPLKPAHIYKSLAERVNQAKRIAKHPKIKISTIEESFRNNYTYNTLRRIISMHPDTEFVWLMGLDNMQNFTQWYRWKDIISLLPIVIFDRGNEIYKTLKGKVAAKFEKNCIINSNYNEALEANSLYLMRIKKNNLSSTMIRRLQQNG